MPTYTVGSGKTYSTISLAVAAIPGALGGAIHEVVVDAGTYAESVTISGHSGTSSSAYISLKPASGDKHLGDFSTGVIIDNNAASVLTTSDAYTRVTDITVKKNTDTVGNYHVTINTGNNQFYRNVLVENPVNSAGAIAATGGSGHTFENCVIWNSSGDTTARGRAGIAVGPDAKIYHCVIRKYQYAIQFGSPAATTGFIVDSTVLFPNTSISGNESINDFSVTGYSPDGDYNAGSDATTNGANSIKNLSDAEWTDEANGDFSISEGGILDSAGNPNTINDLSEATDITGLTITSSNVPIGAFAFLPPVNISFGDSEGIEVYVNLDDVTVDVRGAMTITVDGVDVLVNLDDASIAVITGYLRYISGRVKQPFRIRTWT